MTVDFFGFVTLNCIVCITDDGDRYILLCLLTSLLSSLITYSLARSIVNGDTEPALTKQPSLSYNFTSMLNTKGEVKYGTPFIINASIPGEQRTKCFAISKVNNFVAASLTSDSSVIKIEPFIATFNIEPNSR